MAVAFDGTRISRADDSDTDGGDFNKWGLTQAASDEADFVYETGGTNGYAMSNKISNTTGGVDVLLDTAVDFSSPNLVILAKVNVTTYGLIDTTVHKGTMYQIGSGTHNTTVQDYHIHGLFQEYPPKGGWVILAIDPNEAAYIDLTTGTPDLNNIDHLGWWADIAGLVKSENIVMDAIDYMAATGDGLTWTGTDGTFQDFVDFDEGTGANRYGVVTTESGALVVTGFLNIGSATATTFSDSNVAVVWKDSLTAAGFGGLGIDLSNSSQDISIVDCFLQGNGRGYQKEIFGTKADVDATNDVITSITQGWMDLDYVTYSKEGGTDSMGLTDTNSYWVAYDAANSGWAFYSSRANAAADTSRATLSLGSTGEDHSLIKAPDTRPDIVVTGTTATVGVDLTGTTINNFRNITLTSKALLDGCKIVGCEQITQAAGTITDCIVSGATTDDDEAFIESAGSLQLISGCDFTFSNGHAIRCTATGTYNFNNYFTGYGADASTDAAFHNDSGGLITLNIGAGYDSPTVLNGSGASTVIASTADLTFTPLISGSEVRIFQAGTRTEEDGVESSGTSFVYTYNTSDTFNIDYRIIKPGYRIIERYNVPLTDADANETVAQEEDLAYNNP